MVLEYLPDVERILIKAENKTELRGIKNWFNRYEEGYMFNPRFKMKVWDGKVTEYDVKTGTIPMGLWREAVRCCQEFGYPCKFINKNEFPINRSVKMEMLERFYDEFFEGYTIDGNPFKIRDYQIQCAYNILKSRYCNISVATSGGKTLIFSLVLFYLLANQAKGKKFLLVVPSKTLVTQFYDDLLEFNRGKLDINIQEIFAENEKPRTTHPDREPNMVIGTFQSLVEYDKTYFKQFWSITSDEGHKGASASYRKINKRTFRNAYYRWGMSGSFYKDDTADQMKIMAVTGPVVDIVKARKLMDAGYITKVKIKGVLMHHNDYEFAERLEIVASRDKKSCYDLECEKIQESEERLMIINKIVSACKANTLVLFHNTEYGQRLLEYLQSRNPDLEFHYIDGKVSNKKRNVIKKEMEKTDKVRILVASFGCLSTGVSIKAITNVIFTQSFKKAQVIIQSIGRALRLHKDKKLAVIFDLVDIFKTDNYARRTRSQFKNILLTHWEKRTAIYEEEEYPTETMSLQLKEW
jgi:superfamily II DNA or RNA helicase